MKILLFEYICGGGFHDQELPDSLAQEGWLMLQSLLSDLIAIKEHEISLLLDWRFVDSVEANCNILSVSKDSDVMTLFQKSLKEVDAVWLIAPESGQILFDFTRLVESADKLLLASPSSAIAQAADKWQTFRQLSTHGIPAVTTAIFNEKSRLFSQGSVIKARDGVGCEHCFFIDSAQVLQSLSSQLSANDYIIQPFEKGEALSLCALFKNGRATLLCINRQIVEMENRHFKLNACEVNIEQDDGQFQNLCSQIAAAFPDLWGYVGIDFIRGEDKVQVLEINPRLTSSYAGIRQALGINVAEQVLQLMHSGSKIEPTCNQTLRVNLC